MKSISIVVPCYNCQTYIGENIIKLIKKIKIEKINYEIILIKDGSKDNTLEELKKTTLKNKRITIISYGVNVGKSHAVQKGIKKSIYEYVLLIDCDLPYLDSFSKIIKNLKNNYDLVIVNRRNKKSVLEYKKISVYQVLRNMLGYLIGFVITKVLNMKIDDGVADTQAGLKGFKKIKKLKKINFISRKYFLDIELIYFFYKNNNRIKTVPVKYQISNNSNIKILSIFSNLIIVKELFKVLYFLKLRKMV